MQARLHCRSPAYQDAVPFLTPKVVSGGLQASLTRALTHVTVRIACRVAIVTGGRCRSVRSPRCCWLIYEMVWWFGRRWSSACAVHAAQPPNMHTHTQPAASEKTGQAPKYRLIPRNISFFSFFFFPFFPVPRSSCFGHHVCHQLTCNGLNAGGGWRPTAQRLNVTTQLEGGLSTNTNQSTKLYLDKYKYKYKGISIRRILLRRWT